jgi:hypothetical protein
MKLFVPILILVSLFAVTFGATSYFSVGSANLEEIKDQLQSIDANGTKMDGPLTEALTKIQK